MLDKVASVFKALWLFKASVTKEVSCPPFVIVQVASAGLYPVFVVGIEELEGL